MLDVNLYIFSFQEQVYFNFFQVKCGNQHFLNKLQTPQISSCKSPTYRCSMIHADKKTNCKEKWDNAPDTLIWFQTRSYSTEDNNYFINIL